MNNSKTSRDLALITLSFLFVAIVAKYYFRDLWIADNFNTPKVVLGILVPLLVNKLWLKIPLADLGIAWPKMDKKMIGLVTFALIAIPAIVYLVMFSDDFLSFYAERRVDAFPLSERLSGVLLFTFSSVIPSEFMHRSFMLFGISYLLSKREKLDPKVATTLALFWVCMLEVVHHFQKPDVEALGLLIGSPLLSWIALRTRSFVLPLLIHLYLECWFSVLIVGS